MNVCLYVYTRCLYVYSMSICIHAHIYLLPHTVTYVLAKMSRLPTITRFFYKRALQKIGLYFKKRPSNLGRLLIVGTTP